MATISRHLDDDRADRKGSEACRLRLPGAARVRGVTKNDAHAALVERKGEVAAGGRQDQQVQGLMCGRS
jgi:hypothetical protein